MLNDSKGQVSSSCGASACLPSSGSPCTGCGLCVSVCGHGAIRMQENNEGFLVAVVDPECCVGCGACEKMCARLAKVEGSVSHRFYEAWSLDDTRRMASSSGGVFSELALDWIRRGGVVYGVAMPGGDFPRFVEVEREEELPQLRGSKYLQADPAGIFSRMAEMLKTGRPVLFAGVSCQVRAARVRFGERYGNLLLVDLACFGVPSRHLWRSFVSGLGNQSGIAGVAFRDKSRSWREYCMRIDHADGACTLIHRDESPFMRGFLCHMGLNECCYTCRSAVADRPGDVSLGDFWGRPPQEDDQAGVSVVIAHTPRGNAALERICPNLHFAPVDEPRAVSCNGGLVAHAGGLPPQRAAFLHALRHGELRAVLRRFMDAAGRPRPGLCLGKCFFPCPHHLHRALRKIRKLSGGKC